MSKGADNRAKSEGKVPVFSYDRCKACDICVHFCPRQALETGKDGYPRLPDSGACNACRQCERLCPDFAVCLEACLTDEPGHSQAPEEVAVACLEACRT